MSEPRSRTGETIAAPPPGAKADVARREAVRGKIGGRRVWIDWLARGGSLAAESLLDLVAPGSCRHCGDEVAGSRALCDGCEGQIAWVDRVCRVCGEPVIPVAELPGATRSAARELWICGECRRRRPAHSRVIVAGRYRGPLRTAIVRFKYAGDVACGRFIVDALARAARRAGLAASPGSVDAASELCVTSVPAHFIKRLVRGRDHAAELARDVALSLSIPYRPTLRKVRWTPAQVTLSSSARRENLRRAFRPLPWCRDLRGRRIVLVDDVLTTGTTTARAARVLRRHGAREIIVLVVARS